MVTGSDILAMAVWLGVMPSVLLALRATESPVEDDARFNAESATDVDKGARGHVALPCEVAVQ